MCLDCIELQFRNFSKYYVAEFMSDQANAHLRMEPIYWSPVHDIAPVIRATWFYADNMLPVEVDIANLLEVGYMSLQPWTETWADELNSAVEVGAVGEMKVLHQLWPAKPKPSPSRPSTSRLEGGLTPILE